MQHHNGFVSEAECVGAFFLYHSEISVMNFHCINISMLFFSLTFVYRLKITKYTHIRDFPLLETSLFVLMSYATFLAAEAAKLTGNKMYQLI